MKELLKRIPIVTTVGRGVMRIYRAMGDEARHRHARRSFVGSRNFWEDRYATGGNSGPGSCNKLAEFKAEVINEFVAKNAVQSVIEFGCGDGNQLGLAAYPRYLGFDVSVSAVALCRDRFAGDTSKSFEHLDAYTGETAELTMSLDVIFHLVEDDVFNSYMKRLFNSSVNYVIIYSSNTSSNDANMFGFLPQIRHRKFTDWVDKHMLAWKLFRFIPNRYPFAGDSHTGSFSDFYIYEKKRTA